MNLKICVNAVDGCKAWISEQDSDQEYLTEGSNLTAKYRFEYGDTASIDVFKLNKTTGETLTPHIIRLRDGSEQDVPLITLESDGWFTAIHVVLPTEDWVMRETSKDGSIIRVYSVVYYTNGSDIYKYADGKSSRISIEELLDAETEDTTISKVSADYVSICYLQSALNESYQKIMEERMYNGSCHIDACEANRLTALVNLVKHYVRWGQLAEAERVIEKINYSTVISTDTVDRLRTKGCGCGWT